MCGSSIYLNRSQFLSFLIYPSTSCPMVEYIYAIAITRLIVDLLSYCLGIPSTATTCASGNPGCVRIGLLLAHHGSTNPASSMLPSLSRSISMVTFGPEMGQVSPFTFINKSPLFSPMSLSITPSITPLIFTGVPGISCALFLKNNHQVPRS